MRNISDNRNSHTKPTHHTGHNVFQSAYKCGLAKSQHTIHDIRARKMVNYYDDQLNNRMSAR